MSGFRIAIAAALLGVMLSAPAWADTHVRPPGYSPAPEISEMSDTVIAATIGVVGLLIGVLLTVSLEEYRAWRDRKLLVRSVASALFTEVFPLAGWCATHGSEWNALQHAEEVPFSTVNNLAPPPSSAFDALASQVHVFDAATVSSIIMFYGAMDMVRGTIKTATPVGAESVIKKEDAESLAFHLGEVCRFSTKVIVLLKRQAKLETTQKDIENYTQLKADLKIVVAGGVLPL